MADLLHPGPVTPSLRRSRRPAPDRLKRRMLQDLVQQNVDLIRGGAAPRRLRRRWRLRRASRLLVLALLPAGLFGSTRLLSTRDAGPLRPAAAAPAATTAAAVAPVHGTPQPIDSVVFPFAVRRVAIDPGHGGDSTGTLAPSGVIEKEVTLDIAERLERLLAERSFEVVMTREEDRAVSLKERALLANEAEADIFVSIHVNWLENRRARGVETYYLGATDDPYLTQLAAAENRESGYALADLRPLLDRIYADVRQHQSRALAEVVQRSLFRSLGKVNPELEDRGVKSAPFVVLMTTEMPAILAEVSCLSNEEEARLLAKPLYRQYIAAALADGIDSWADQLGAAGQKGP